MSYLRKIALLIVTILALGFVGTGVRVISQGMNGPGAWHIAVGIAFLALVLANGLTP